MANYNRKYLGISTLLCGLPIISHAQSLYEQYQLEIIVTLAAVVALLGLLSLLVALYAMKAVMQAKTERPVLDETVPKEVFWRRFLNKLNQSVPVAEESGILTDHAYDGIRELDNRLPPWWLYGFYSTIIFGVIYLAHFHVFGTGDLQEEEYRAEMLAAEQEVVAYLASMDHLIDETNVELLASEVELADGAGIFATKCAACHGQLGEGGVGPNLTDQYWLHGGTMKGIFKTIKYGVPSKGMISWQGQLSPKEMQQVASFIYNMEGSDPPNAKEPQGELFEREVTEAATDESAGPEETES